MNISKLPCDTVYLVDLHGFLHRYFAVRPDVAAENCARKCYQLFHNGSPYVVFASDPTERGTSFRHTLAPESSDHPYKGNRSRDEAKDAAFAKQLRIFEELMEDTLGLPVLQVPGFEGDDIIASLEARVVPPRYTLILGFDKDLYQLIGSFTKMWDGGFKDVVTDREEVYAKLGVYPHQMVDYQTLVGDSGDNLPGVRNIGPEGAKAILDVFDNLDTALDSAEMYEGIIRRDDTVVDFIGGGRAYELWEKNRKLWSALAGARDRVAEQRQLCKLRTDAPIPQNILDRLELR